MTPEQFQKAKSIFQGALERDPAVRAAFLNEACGGDAELKRDVESLLAFPDQVELPRIVAEAMPTQPAGSGPTPSPSERSRPGTTTALSAGARLGPYEILELLGAGGMGEVYRARDERLRRDVAIKVLPATFAQDTDRVRRFEREARAAAGLSHPNIMAIHDVGLHEGVPYLVAELLEGETLRSRLDKGALPLRKAIDYAIHIAHGLTAAHEKGIVHRDLKPANLFLTKDGRVKILDFGLAKATRPERTDGPVSTAPTAAADTEAGMVLGTAGYMSPEQVLGQPVEARSDLFSFGSVLYEMLTGHHAFARKTRVETMSAILNDDPPELLASRAGIPPALTRIVFHCLEKNPGERFQSAQDIAFALSEASGQAMTSGAHVTALPAGNLKAIIAATVVVVLAAAGVFLLWRSRKTATDAGGVKRVAVLPFENLSAAEDDYFADGIADEIRGKLTSLPGVEVIARASSTPYKKTTKTSKQIAQELDVKYLLTATVRWQKGTGASRVHVSPELVEVRESGAPASKWQQPFDAAVTDIFQVQSDIATRVAQALGVALGSVEEKRLMEKPTQNLAAYEAFLKGEEAMNRLGNDLSSPRKALGFYEQAVALDPGFAQAWARASQANSWVYRQDSPRPEFAERARQAAEKAAALAPDHPESYLALGIYQGYVLHDRTGAIEQFAKAQRVAPGNARVLLETGMYEESLGRWGSAVEHLSQGVRLDPRNAFTQAALGIALNWVRRYPEAREAFDRGLALAPASLASIHGKVIACLGEGDLVAARAVVKSASRQIEPTALVVFLAYNYDLVWVLDESQRELLLRLTPSAFENDRGNQGLCLTQAYALKGDAANVRTYAEEARKAYEEQVRAAPEDGVGRSNLGVALAYLGQKKDAIREGERGVALVPATKDAWAGPYIQHQLARIYILFGEQEKALDQLEQLLKIPYYLSPALLRIDPNFDPLRKNPRFQKLVAEKQGKL